MTIYRGTVPADVPEALCYASLMQVLVPVGLPEDVRCKFSHSS